VFTILLYARPSELYPSAFTASITLVVGIITLAFFIPTQLALEGNLSAPMREVNLLMLFCATAVLSIPLAMNPLTAWQEFSGTFIRCVVIFVVIINATRTETRLRTLLLIALGAAIWLSLGTINDFRLGLSTVEGYRARGRGGGIFGNPNDMALYLVSMVPIALALAMTSRRVFSKWIFRAVALVTLAAIGLSYSRGGFLGVVVALGFFALKVAPNRKIEIILGGCLLLVVLLVVFPSYAIRIASIVAPSLDPVGSSDSRKGELMRSLFIAIRHPFLGIGMNNYPTEMSELNTATHNSYTQVACEMGVAALVIYVSFMLVPLKKLGQIAREAVADPANNRFFYMAIGLQAALVGYMVSSFFASDAYQWYVYYLAGYAICLRRLYEAQTGKQVVVTKRKERSRQHEAGVGAFAS
jgi:putative inorganic carbon (hco3(-)) transporter